MNSHHDISPEDVEALRRFDSCTLSNAIELLDLRPRNVRIHAGSRCSLHVCGDPAGGWICRHRKDTLGFAACRRALFISSFMGLILPNLLLRFLPILIRSPVLAASLLV